MKTNSFLYYLQVEPDLFPFFTEKIYAENIIKKIYVLNVS